METPKACGGPPASCCFVFYAAPPAGKRPGCAALWLRPWTSGGRPSRPSTSTASRTSTLLVRRLLWLALPAFASVLLLATTNHVCQDMPAVPFLWVVPLSLYLLSFIIAFDHERWYRRLPYGLAALIAIYLTAGMCNPFLWGSGLVGISP